MAKNRIIIKNEQKEDGGSGTSDSNKVSYNQADNKTKSEQSQARANVGNTAMNPQIITTNGAINDLEILSNNLIFTGSNVSLSGIVAGELGQEITITGTHSINGERMKIIVSSLSLQNNRFSLSSNASIEVSPNHPITFKYGNNNRWNPQDLNVHPSTIQSTGAVLYNGYNQVGGSFWGGDFRPNRQFGLNRLNYSGVFTATSFGYPLVSTGIANNGTRGYAGSLNTNGISLLSVLGIGISNVYYLGMLIHNNGATIIVQDISKNGINVTGISNNQYDIQNVSGFTIDFQQTLLPINTL